jgi:hypothetical protein
MKDEENETSMGLNEIFELINTKGDIGEIKDILQSYEKEEKSES